MMIRHKILLALIAWSCMVLFLGAQAKVLYRFDPQLNPGMAVVNPEPLVYGNGKPVFAPLDSPGLGKENFHVPLTAFKYLADDMLRLVGNTDANTASYLVNLKPQVWVSMNPFKDQWVLTCATLGSACSIVPVFENRQGEKISGPEFNLPDCPEDMKPAMDPDWKENLVYWNLVHDPSGDMAGWHPDTDIKVEIRLTGLRITPRAHHDRFWQLIQHLGAMSNSRKADFEENEQGKLPNSLVWIDLFIRDIHFEEPWHY